MSKALTTINATADEFNTIQRQCKLAIASGFLPDTYRQGTIEQQIAKAATIALKGRELGIPMMQAFSHIHVINGKPAISSELMLALIYRALPNAVINFKEYTDQACIIEAARDKDRPTSNFSFTLKDAEKAGLLTRGDNWRKYPRAMLRARCVAEMARSMFPDAIMGASYTPEELGSDIVETNNGSVMEASFVSSPIPNDVVDDIPDFPVPKEPAIKKESHDSTQEELSEEELRKRISNLLVDIAGPNANAITALLKEITYYKLDNGKERWASEIDQLNFKVSPGKKVSQAHMVYLKLKKKMEDEKNKEKQPK